MKKKSLISLGIILVSGVAFIANYVSADEPISSSDPNVIALTIVRGEPPCYWHSKTKKCIKEKADGMCAACDVEIIIHPDKD